MSGYDKTSPPAKVSPTDPALVMLSFVAQAVVTKEDVTAMIERQMKMLKLTMPALPELKGELRSFEFYGKYSDIMHTACGEDMHMAEAVTNKDVMKCCFLAKAFVKKEIFQTLVTKQLKMLGKTPDGPVFAELGDTLNYHEFLVAYTATFELSAILNTKLMQFMFNLHALLDKNTYIKVVGHQLEMMHMDAGGASGEGLDDAITYHAFLTAYEIALAAQCAQSGTELSAEKKQGLMDVVFNLHATMTADAFKKLVGNQAKMMKKGPPDFSSIPDVITGPAFFKSYREVMSKLF